MGLKIDIKEWRLEQSIVNIINHSQRLVHNNLVFHHLTNILTLHIFKMVSSLSLLMLLASQITSVTLAAPLPQSAVAANQPAGPPMTTAADLMDNLGDLVIPQAQHSNETSTEPMTEKRSPPADFASLEEALGDLKVPSDTTAASIAEAAK